MTMTSSTSHIPHPHDNNHISPQSNNTHQEHRYFSLTLFQIMIEAAKATASLDDETHFHITHEIKACTHQDVIKETLLTNLEKPVSLDTLISETQDQQQKIDIYLAARLGVDPHKSQNSFYLDMLRKRLDLDEETIEKAQNSFFKTIADTLQLQ